MKRSILGSGLTAVCLVIAMPAMAKVGADEAAQLGQSLTPVGAEKAGNADGSIPAWTPAARRGPLSGEYPSNPKVDAEKPLFTITKANVAQYKDKLTKGHLKLLDSYDTYKMNVYPSHRLVSWPDEIYAASHENAVNCEMIGVDNPNNCKLGFPFPIPKSSIASKRLLKSNWRAETSTRVLSAT